MIRETADADEINSFANHPEIRPCLSGDGPLDLTPGIYSPNAYLFGQYGGFCFIWSGPGTYEVHVMITPEGRGAWGVRAGKQAISIMASLGMEHLWARMHPARPEMATYARLCGLSDTGIIHKLDAGDGPVSWRIFNWRA